MTTTPAQRLEASIRLGVAAEEDWDGPSIKPGALTDDQISWLASWMAGDGCDKPPKPWEIEAARAKASRVTYSPREVSDADAITQAFTAVLGQLGYAVRMVVETKAFGQRVVTVAAEPAVSDPPVTVEP